MVSKTVLDNVADTTVETYRCAHAEIKVGCSGGSCTIATTTDSITLADADVDQVLTVSPGDILTFTATSASTTATAGALLDYD